MLCYFPQGGSRLFVKRQFAPSRESGTLGEGADSFGLRGDTLLPYVAKRGKGKFDVDTSTRPQNQRVSLTGRRAPRVPSFLPQCNSVDNDDSRATTLHGPPVSPLLFPFGLRWDAAPEVRPPPLAPCPMQCNSKAQGQSHPLMP